MDPNEVSERIAEKFTRVMNATPSPRGAWCDLTAASVLSGLLLVVGFFVIRKSNDPRAVELVLFVAALPLSASFLLSLTLGGSRRAVVRWLASLPFPIENMNAVLAGLGDTIEVVFEPGVEPPARSSLQPALEAISEDVLYVSERPDERTIEIRLGVIDSKRMPLRTNHLRWRRLVDVVERGLVPLSKTSAIQKVQIV
jgi:hypothetical protein